MARSQIHDQFVARFGNGAASPHFSEVDLRVVEHQLGVSFPEAYRAFLAVHGAVSVKSLLGVIVDTGAEVHDLMSFILTSEISEVSQSSWSAGMRSELVAFAIDSMGNFICFLRTDLLGERPDDAPVWFFDHDFCTDGQIAESFDSLLTVYLRLPDADREGR